MAVQCCEAASFKLDEEEGARECESEEGSFCKKSTVKDSSCLWADRWMPCTCAGLRHRYQGHWGLTWPHAPSPSSVTAEDLPECLLNALVKFLHNIVKEALPALHLGPQTGHPMLKVLPFYLAMVQHALASFATACHSSSSGGCSSSSWARVRIESVPVPLGEPLAWSFGRGEVEGPSLLARLVLLGEGRMLRWPVARRRGDCRPELEGLAGPAVGIGERLAWRLDSNP
eukprot:CAMPEP_0202364116 /NCGR_PEP_ID=MMETSP1126-20121109/15640_1 /ASSEMBLY_ACC=CAM_ASM_000457 /TAXON_ID=3047 /ORGANISM="Dunaliella tertiolecta, Strain CCMP1320" /LENGTH=228 /DNA_ID=CAMNT_0048958669 /DNA_START=881 /DNA_END=1570 /DNA_ORIENTATION=-